MVQKPLLLARSAMDFTKVFHRCIEHMNAMEERTHQKDGEHFIYEAVLEAVYGPNVWAWVRQQQQA